MIEQIAITSFIVFAIWFSMQEGEIFSSLGRFFEQVLPEKLHKPVFDCPVCMGFWYGSAVYWIVWADSVKWWLVTVIAVVGFNAIIVKLWPDD